ncbi:hypothetical protein MRX96_045504 [Rhipicephalus microplus]
MSRFTRLEECVASIETPAAAVDSHLTTLDARVDALETRQSASEATIAHRSLPAQPTPARTPTTCSLYRNTRGRRRLPPRHLRRQGRRFRDPTERH